MIPSAALYKFGSLYQEQLATSGPNPEVVAQWVSNLIKQVADLTFEMERQEWRKGEVPTEALIGETPEANPVVAVPMETTPALEEAQTAMAGCPVCGGQEVHTRDCSVAAYIRSAGLVNPNLVGLKESILSSPNPAVIPQCPECGARGGHFVTCSVVQAQTAGSF